MRWKASTMLDDRIDGQRLLLDLAGRSVLPPSDLNFSPREDALRYRAERLLTA
jgi:hypothetical protein